MSDVAELWQRMAELPAERGANETEEPWIVREGLLDAGHGAALRLEQWEEVLAFKGIQESERQRQASPNLSTNSRHSAGSGGGAPLVLAPERDDPELGADPTRNNAFLYAADDPRGLKCPLHSHVRRTYRDANTIGVARLHRIVRRSTSYGPMLPDGVLEDDGVDRGIVYVSFGSHLDRQFEFVRTQWIINGTLGTPEVTDPLVGPHDKNGEFTIPQRPIRRRLTGLPQFVVNRGGEYFFMPGLRALRWVADLGA